jgi:hypothetical protein
MIPPGTACSARNAIRVGRFHASPHNSEARVNATTQARNRRVAPRRSLSQLLVVVDTPSMSR